MSTAGPHDPQTQPNDFSAYVSGGQPIAGVPSPQPASVDPLLIQQTKNEIRSLVQEITQLSRATIPSEQFYEEFLRRVVSALAAHGGVIWTISDGRSLDVQYQINLSSEASLEDDEPRARHAALLKNVLASGQATLVPPQSSSTDEEAGNPTPHLLVLAPLRVEQQPIGVIEVFQRHSGGPTTQRGYLRFLVQMADLAGEFLKSNRLRHLGDRQTLWENLERFIREVHRHLDSKATAYTVVNESRRLIQCDRVSMAVAQWRRHHVIAVSGLDTIDRRAEEVKLLGRLATVVAAVRKPLWHTGGKQDIPPQIERHLDAYLDRSHATLLAVIPLYPPEDAGSLRPRGSSARAPIGTLIIEQLSDNRLQQGMVERTETVAAHSASAFCNALEHESLFLMPLWRALGRSKWVVRARTLPKIVLAFAAVLAVLAGLVLVPTDFELSAHGKLQPAVRRDIFSHIDGVVVEVPARHEQLVQPQEVLARLTNNGLDVELSNLVGRQRTTQERIQNAQRAQLDARHSSIEEQNRLAGELLELRQVEESLERELALLRQQEERLVVRSAMHGQVVTWNVGEALLGRPVQKGQLLMTVVDLSGDWELELYMPERRMGHVARAAARSTDGLTVTYMLASHPDRHLAGRVVEIQRMAEVRGEDGNCVLMRVTLDKEDLPDMRSETTVTARVNCGRRPAGYVLFHELIETVQSKVLFWF